MCGIAGIVGLHADVDPAILDTMCQAIYHRGPDASGTYVHRETAMPVALGSRRLSIIDLSEAGNMPLTNETSDVWIVYNGELYNHRSLREALLARGHNYRSNTDTETVVHAYEEYGLECLNSFNGMYAFALYDQRQQRVVLARDPMGIKPLYYAERDGVLLFCSELRGILAALPATPNVDPDALNLYLSLGYVPSPFSICEGVRKLPPGTALLVEPTGISVRRFWTPQVQHTSTMDTDIGRLVSTVRELVESSVARQLMSDVPVGVFLSGGLDSTIVTALAQKHHGQTMDTFSVGFGSPDGTLDEKDLYNHDLMHARQVAATLGTQHHEIIIPTDSRIVDHFCETFTHLDEPLWESSFVSLSFMSRLARENGVKVVLTGDGGDELFGGYPWYSGAQRFEKMQRVPFLQHALPMLQALGHNRPLGEKAGDLRRRLRQDDVGRYRTNHDIFGESDKDALISGRSNEDRQDLASLYIGKLFRASGATTWSEKLAIADLTLWVREHFNQRVDRMSMMHSIEARVPLQDQTVVDFALGVPLALKLYAGQSKYLLRQAFADIIPAAVLNRPKRPFAVPAWTWLRGPMREFTQDMLSPTAISARGLLDPEAVQRIVAGFMAGNDRLAFKTWALLNLQVWLDISRKRIQT